MTSLYIHRRLHIGSEEISESEALQLGRLLVVLGEPGCGKTELLREFGRHLKVTPIRASQFRHRANFSEKVPLIIDALDEASNLEQSSVEEIFVKAHDVSDGYVIFASRSSEWEAARMTQLRECFGIPPTAIRISAFNHHEQELLLRDRFPAIDGQVFSKRARDLGLEALLGNPQFLILFAHAYIQNGYHFASKAKIFEDAVKRLAGEANGGRIVGHRPAGDDIVGEFSAVAAKLLLAGASGVSSTESRSTIDYPYLLSLTARKIDAFPILDTMLFKLSAEADHHEPVHRIVAEYCAANFIISKLADKTNPLSLRRILAVIAPNGSMRQELRGLLGWLAALGPERVQRASIEIDAYAVFANGDPSRLANASKQLLLSQLQVVAKEDPQFFQFESFRNFGLNGFVTPAISVLLTDLLDHPMNNAFLVALLLKIIEEDGCPTVLMKPVLQVALTPGIDWNTRIKAAEMAVAAGHSPSEEEMTRLLSNECADSLPVAGIFLWHPNNAAFNAELGEAWLFAIAAYFQANQQMSGEGAYWISRRFINSIELIPASQVVMWLERLEAHAKCICSEPTGGCVCRHGLGKIAAWIIEHYFKAAIGPHEPGRLETWLHSLLFAGRSQTIKHVVAIALFGYPTIREELFKRFFSTLQTREEIVKEVKDLLEHKSRFGLVLEDGDGELLANFAFQAGNIIMWEALLVSHNFVWRNKSFDSLRRRLRDQARQKSAFLRLFYWLERPWRQSRRAAKLSPTYRARLKKRGSRQKNRLRVNLSANREAVRSGQNIEWIGELAKAYMNSRTELVEYGVTTDLVEEALANALPGLVKVGPAVETLALTTNRTHRALAAAACWVFFQKRRSLHGFDASLLLEARIEMAWPRHWMSKQDYDRFNIELDRVLYSTPEETENLIRRCMEPALVSDQSGSVALWWLRKQEGSKLVHSKLALDWLRKFPALDHHQEISLFDIASEGGDRTSLIDVIEAKIRKYSARTVVEQEKEAQYSAHLLLVWRVRKFFLATTDDDGWKDLSKESSLMFVIAGYVGVASSDEPFAIPSRVSGWRMLSPQKIFKIIDAFVDVYPKVALDGSEPAERYLELLRLVWLIDEADPESALPVLNEMLLSPRFMNFSHALRALRSKAVRRKSATGFSPPPPKEITSIFAGDGIASVEDLRAFIVEELEWLQSWLRSSETDPLAAFYENGRHVSENSARNRVVDGLNFRMTALNMPVIVEHTLSQSVRCDFSASAMIGGRRQMLVVEAKGQWHPNLFTAAADQLSRLYASHQDAHGQGIYLVFWYGPHEKIAGHVRHDILTSIELKAKIVAELTSELQARIDVVVLDLSHVPN